ncbi:ribosomal protein S12 methylthiotransferase accessory factor [Paenarthrobacter nitroguajacolicus]|uniref:YcaO-like family protein n=1 Tax=Paenarthrobacter nitroguajacolicus TaxID=211146 RepID=UPI0028627A69|nr:YcaO-like family protein [Paenarthrobacter nitroguajacolicus]MDR6989617.1 ribosomal protein S12 methylthiotransferase accessory factor [Paenarthrobacter nitroguajacolicus]
MSLDPLQTLDPASGLVSESAVYVPNDVGLWRTAGLLAQGRTSQAGFAAAVGAFDVKKRDSLTRGAGEAVERFALVPAQADSEYLLAREGSLDQRIDFITPGLGRPSALAHEFPWYRATNLLTGKVSHVPAPVVDYCPGFGEINPWDGFFDPSPNGAASGPSEDFAQAAGLAEVLERDAFLSAWHQQTPLLSFDVASLPEEVRATPKAKSLLLLLDAARAAGVDPVLAFVPQEGRPLETAVCIIAVEGSFGAMGLKAAAHPVSALRGALQEGLQIRELFLTRTPSGTPPAVTDDDSRADFWTTPAAIDGLLRWVRSFQPSTLREAHPTPDVVSLVEYFAGRDIQAHWVSLTHRLPAAIQDMGWAAGKAICPGTVPLTMDETKGLFLSGHSSTPHPLI